MQGEQSVVNRLSKPAIPKCGTSVTKSSQAPDFYKMGPEDHN